MPSGGAAHSREFRIFETEEFKKAITRLEPPRFLPAKLGAYVYPQLRQNPYVGPNIRKLQGHAPPTWRYRIGSYRLFYAIDADDQIVFLVTIDHRKRAYR